METTLSFAQELRQETRRSHTLAENTSFIKGFLRGLIDHNSYSHLLCSFYHVYQAIELSMQHHQQHDVLKHIAFDELIRLPKIKEDLTFYRNETPLTRVPCTEGTARYVARIWELSETQPELLVAHSYVRYLGDLSGGQILGNLVQRSFRLSCEKGLAFYQFPEIDDPRAFKEKYRQALNDLPITRDIQKEIIEEANHAFALNIGVFEELKGSAIKGAFATFAPNWMKVS